MAQDKEVCKVEKNDVNQNFKLQTHCCCYCIAMKYSTSYVSFYIISVKYFIFYRCCIS